MLLPKKVGSFMLMRKLDADGLAESFVAILDDPAGKQVVARRILPVVARDTGRVAQLRARIGDLRASRHPSLVPIIDLVEADGDLYVLEEWCDGIQIDAVLQHCIATRTSIPHNVYLNLATQVCNALEALHGRPGSESGSENVLHLALCPSAMWVTVDGKVTVGRYGLARSPTSLATAATGALPPGVEYLAPEQTHQDQKLTPASDIFALGAILYEMLTLKPMFRADSSLQTVHRVRRAEVTTQLLEVKEIMPGLDKVLFRALSLNPRHRYQRAFVLREDLRGLMAGYSFNDIDAVTRTFLSPIARSRSEGGASDDGPVYTDAPGDTTGFLLGRGATPYLEPVGDPDSDYTDALLLEDSDAIDLPEQLPARKTPGRGGISVPKREIERDTDRNTDRSGPFDPEEADTAQNVREALDAALEDDTSLRPSSNTAWVREKPGASRSSSPGRRAIEPVDTGYSHRPTAQPLGAPWNPPEAFQGIDDAETTGPQENTTNLLEPTTGPIDDLLLEPPDAMFPPVGRDRQPEPRSIPRGFGSEPPASLSSSSAQTAPHTAPRPLGASRDTIPIGKGKGDPETLDIDPDTGKLPDTAGFARRSGPSAPPRTVPTAQDRQGDYRGSASRETRPNPAPTDTFSTQTHFTPAGRDSTRTLDLQDPDTAGTAEQWTEIPTQSQPALAASAEPTRTAPPPAKSPGFSRSSSVTPANEFVAPPPVEKPVGFDLPTTQAPSRGAPPAEARAPMRRPIVPPPDVPPDAGDGARKAFLTMAGLVLAASVAVAVCAGLGAAGVVATYATGGTDGTTLARVEDPDIQEVASLDANGVAPAAIPGEGSGTAEAGGVRPEAIPAAVAPTEPPPEPRSKPPGGGRLPPAPPPPPMQRQKPQEILSTVPKVEPRPAPVPRQPDPVPTRTARTPRPDPLPDITPLPALDPIEPAPELPGVADVVEPALPMSEYERWSQDAFEGHLSPAARSQLAAVPTADPGYTRARTLLYLDAKIRGAKPERDGHLMAMMALPENRYNPVLLVETAQLAIEREDWLTALNDSRTAEQHWGRLPSELVYSRKAMIYEIQAVAQTGLFYASDGEDKDRLFQAIRNWERYRSHVATKSNAELMGRADERLTHLNEIQRRLE